MHPSMHVSCLISAMQIGLSSNGGMPPDGGSLALHWRREGGVTGGGGCHAVRTWLIASIEAVTVVVVQAGIGHALLANQAAELAIGGRLVAVC